MRTRAEIREAMAVLADVFADAAGLPEDVENDSESPKGSPAKRRRATRAPAEPQREVTELERAMGLRMLARMGR